MSSIQSPPSSLKPLPYVPEKQRLTAYVIRKIKLGLEETKSVVSFSCIPALFSWTTESILRVIAKSHILSEGFPCFLLIPIIIKGILLIHI
jgi:hypothetical protein